MPLMAVTCCGLGIDVHAKQSRRQWLPLWEVHAPERLIMCPWHPIVVSESCDTVTFGPHILPLA